MIRTPSLPLVPALIPFLILGIGGEAKASSAQAEAPVLLAQASGSGTADQDLSPSDRINLDQAENACMNGDYRTFFNAFAQSAAVREKYSAARITRSVLNAHGKVISSQTLRPEEYRTFPVLLIDYDYKPAKPSRAGDAEEYLDLQFNQSQNNDISVEWSRIHYDGQSAGGDDRGNPLDADGKLVPPGTHQYPEGQLLSLIHISEPTRRS